MEIKLFINKNIEENASMYFEKAKKSKKKLSGALENITKYLEKLKILELKQVDEKDIVLEQEKPKRKKQWYEKFRWFHSSEGFLVIGGRDATSNDIIVKKHADKDDLVFHTDMSGSPFFIVKKDSLQGIDIGESTKEETAQATASYNSKAWRNGLSTLDVFYVKPDQVTKQAQPGEYLNKGSFMIRGKTTYLHPNLELAIGLKGDIVIGGPVNAIKSQTKNFVIIVQGKEKASQVAKIIRSKFKVNVDLDDIIRFLPGGGCQIQK